MPEAVLSLMPPKSAFLSQKKQHDLCLLFQQYSLARKSTSAPRASSIWLNTLTYRAHDELNIREVRTQAFNLCKQQKGKGVKEKLTVK